jgi:hypothetical protein
MHLDEYIIFSFIREISLDGVAGLCGDAEPESKLVVVVI